MIYNLVDKFLMNDFTKYIAEEINKGDKTDISIFDLGCFFYNTTSGDISNIHFLINLGKYEKSGNDQ